MSDIGMDRFALPAVLSVAGMHQMLRFALQVGNARREYKVRVPETNGPDGFVRTFRAHQNALESYPLTVVGLWLGSVFVHPVPASLLYTGYLIGREHSFRGYCESPEKRLPGLFFGYRCLLMLMVLMAAGTGNSLVRYYFDVDVLNMIWNKLPWCQQ